MRRVITLAFFMIWVITGCRKDSSHDQVDSCQIVLKEDTSNTTVISWDRNSSHPFDSAHYYPSTLNKVNLEQIEILLIQSVLDYNNSLSQQHEKYKIDLNGKDYKKQLVVVKNSKGEKEVWVNCFCDESHRLWRTQILSVEDGGPCYFNFKVNLSTKTVYDLIVNGFG